jgi:diguanylate cyclase (GGDEF)-like protein
VCRGHDAVGRWGGDEFMALVTVKDEAEADILADRMQLVTAQSFLNTESGRVTATISVGKAMAVPGDTPDSLFERADASLYEAKRYFHGESD